MPCPHWPLILYLTTQNFVATALISHHFLQAIVIQIQLGSDQPVGSSTTVGAATETVVELDLSLLPLKSTIHFTAPSVDSKVNISCSMRELEVHQIRNTTTNPYTTDYADKDNHHYTGTEQPTTYKHHHTMMISSHQQKEWVSHRSTRIIKYNHNSRYGKTFSAHDCYL